MSAAEFLDAEVEKASERLRARSPWSGQGSHTAGSVWPYGRPDVSAPEDHTEIIRRQALRIGELTEEVMAYQTGRAYEKGYEHGVLAEQHRTHTVRNLLRQVLGCPTHFRGVRFNGETMLPERYTAKRMPLDLLADIVREVQK